MGGSFLNLQSNGCTVFPIDGRSILVEIFLEPFPSWCCPFLAWFGGLLRAAIFFLPVRLNLQV